jgi:hypothetical protein
VAKVRGSLEARLDNMVFKNNYLSQAPVSLSCNSSYSGGRDKEDCIQSQPREIICDSLSQKNPSQKRTGGMVPGVDSEFKLYYCKTKQTHTHTHKTLPKLKMLHL